MASTLVLHGLLLLVYGHMLGRWTTSPVVNVHNANQQKPYHLLKWAVLGNSLVETSVVLAIQDHWEKVVFITKPVT